MFLEILYCKYTSLITQFFTLQKITADTTLDNYVQIYLRVRVRQICLYSRLRAIHNILLLKKGNIILYH